MFRAPTAVSFLHDIRLRFLVNGLDPGKGVPMACAMVYWGEHHERFQEVLLRYGAVLPLDHLKGRVIGRRVPVYKSR